MTPRRDGRARSALGRRAGMRPNAGSPLRLICITRITRITCVTCPRRFA
ncbi:hypothetical protein [Burkholderia ubonensis]|nr:hypothetical protein [Burkholderia ubonensis]